MKVGRRHGEGAGLVSCLIEVKRNNSEEGKDEDSRGMGSGHMCLKHRRDTIAAPLQRG
jgi:hypothetical protein